MIHIIDILVGLCHMSIYLIIRLFRVLLTLDTKNILWSVHLIYSSINLNKLNVKYQSIQSQQK